ncbi:MULTISPECIES: glycerate kinase [unclassified Bacillus (in: firmicutes)]|uniref:glycerate kinase n=1 Tax=unclassified Bacillus (in: firmicutes) TaxID=185979 RepID=UPI0008E7D986|nr:MULTISPECIES: glycerate kinase [unclassified Bacillus (in: firmicutes)]SFA87960.1 glycerate kinase [Bacillus sp. UNCCL13]SFQ84470.1 glycerate kinase [Bacillus sp. cl95]
MKIVIAPDSFKESIASSDVSSAIEKGFLKVFPEAEIVKVPVADGGEGTVKALVDSTGGKIIFRKVTGPLGKPVNAFFGLLGDGNTAIIEMAAASGLQLVPADKRNPLLTTTYGTGELILAALEFGVKKIIVGIGGSATNDGGAGMAQALGARLVNKQGEEIGWGGRALGELAAIDVSGIDSRLSEVKIEVACDVNYPLIGEKGASAIFGPQKGATPEMVKQLDSNLCQFARIVEKDLGKQISYLPGSGAAGGLGGGLLAFLNVELKPGIEIVIQATQLNEIVKDADLVITGEGKMDAQSLHGKTPVGVANIAKQYDIPVLAIVGSIGNDYEKLNEYGIDAVFSIVPGIIPMEESILHAGKYIEQLSINIAKMIKIGGGIYGKKS